SGHVMTPGEVTVQAVRHPARHEDRGRDVGSQAGPLENQNDENGHEQHPQAGNDVGPPQPQRRYALADGVASCEPLSDKPRKSRGVNEAWYGAEVSPAGPARYPFTTRSAAPPGRNVTRSRLCAVNLRPLPYQMVPAYRRTPSAMTIAFTARWAARIFNVTVSEGVAADDTEIGRCLATWPAP